MTNNDNSHYIDVLCVGNASYDLIFLVDHHPSADEKTFANGFYQCGGGPAANAAVAVSRLGGKTAFIGYLGHDVYGDLHLKELEEEKVDTRFIVRGEAQTPLSSILVKPDGQRTVVNYRNDVRYLPHRSFDYSSMKMTPRAMLFDGHEPYVALDFIEIARYEGIATILDAGSVHEGTRLLADKVDYLVCSKKFALDFSNHADDDEALETLSRVNQNVVITLGNKGVIWKTPSGNGKLPAFPVKSVDTTGAGDAFHGAFALCLARGRPWEETLKFSSAVAALSCTKIGARRGLPYRDEVDQFFARE